MLVPPDQVEMSRVVARWVTGVTRVAQTALATMGLPKASTAPTLSRIHSAPPTAAKGANRRFTSAGPLLRSTASHPWSCRATSPASISTITKPNTQLATARVGLGMLSSGGENCHLASMADTAAAGPSRQTRATFRALPAPGKAIHFTRTTREEMRTMTTRLQINSKLVLNGSDCTTLRTLNMVQSTDTCSSFLPFFFAAGGTMDDWDPTGMMKTALRTRSWDKGKN
mmetsp:Transcript_95906/g.219813  ORF Transcript_95906/g.219813 Transcript_95906/m.219813 type:complete len:227 (-) Transcript_95906:221-901(-)